MSEISLFGDDLPEPPKKSSKKIEPKPPRVTKKSLREKAPGVQYRAPSGQEIAAEDEELARVVKLFAEADMLAYDELEKYSDIIEPVISKESRNRMQSWRQSHGS